eukprot:gene31569-6761_t
MVMYEWFSCSLLAMTFAATSAKPYAAAKRYSKKIIEGWRPPRVPQISDDGVWKLITACWDHNPGARPDSFMLLEELEKIMERMNPTPKPSSDFLHAPLREDVASIPSFRIPSFRTPKQTSTTPSPAKELHGPNPKQKSTTSSPAKETHGAAEDTKDSSQMKGCGCLIC